MNKKRKAHLRDWILFSRKVIKTRCGIRDVYIKSRDEKATQEGEIRGLEKLPKGEICKNCLATLHA